MNIFKNMLKKKYLGFAAVNFLCFFIANATHAVIQPVSESFTTVKRFDLAGRVTGVIKPSPDGTSRYPATRTTYYQSSSLVTKVESGYLNTWKDETVDPQDWSSAHFDVSHVTEYTYDNKGRKAIEKTKDNSGVTLTRTEFNYDEYGRVKCETVRMHDGRFDLAYSESSVCIPGPEANHGPDRVTRFEYDEFDQVTAEYRAVGTSDEQRHVRYQYEENRLLLWRVTDANGNVAELKHSNNGRLVKWIFPSKDDTGSLNLLDFEAYSYDGNGNRKTLRKRSEKTITYYYDALNRLIRKDLPDTSKDVYYGYDLQGHQLYARFHSHTHSDGVTMTYSGYGELKSEKNRLGGNNYTTTFDYDKNSLRTFINHYDGNSFKYEYDGIDSLHRISKVTESTPIISLTYDSHARPWQAATGGNAITTLGYDGISRINSIDLNLSGSSGDVDYDFGFNPANQITSLATSNNSYVFTGSGGQEGSYSANGLNQYENINGQSVNHDANGNLTQLGSSNYSYDLENRLISAPGATLSYDPLGRLVEYDLSNTDPVYFLYDGDNVIAEIKNGSMLRRYVHASNMGTPVVQYYGSAVTVNDRQYLHKNHQGSVIGASGSTGSLAYANTYDPFGVPGANNRGRFSYTGQMYLPEIGLHHYRARVYNASIGRFMQTDPVGYEDQINLYTYVANDPLAYIDPTGENKRRPFDHIGACARHNCLKAGVEAIKKAFQRRQPESPKPPSSSSTIREKNLERGVRPGDIGPSGKMKRHKKRHNTYKSMREAGKGSNHSKASRRRGQPRRKQGVVDKHSNANVPPSKKSGGHTHTGGDKKPKVYHVYRRGGSPSLND